jgi:phage baseplate assembly protein W
MAALGTTYLVDIDRFTGELISGWARIKQSIYVILTTRLNSRLMRLWWGSDFLNMQDKPGNEETLITGMMAAVAAINTYEPEFKIRKVQIDEFGPDGVIVITLEGVDLIANNIRTVRQEISL